MPVGYHGSSEPVVLEAVADEQKQTIVPEAYRVPTLERTWISLRTVIRERGLRNAPSIVKNDLHSTRARHAQYC